MKNIGSLIILTISDILLICLAIILKNRKNKKNQVQSIFILLLVLMTIWTFCLILQILFQNSKVDLFFFEKFAAFGACFVPVTVMLFGIVFAKTKVNFKPTILLLYVIPVISTILMFTNDSHHLMYEQYSLNFRETVFGKYFPIHSIYSYSCIFIGLVYLLTYIIKNSGFFSKQSLLILSGVAVSVGTNVLATFGIFDLNVYATPISFTITFVFFALAIFKFDFLKVAPIALQRIVDRISDSYIVVNENNVITDFNQTFLDLFNVKAQDIRNKSLEELFDKYNKAFRIKKDLILRFCGKSKEKSRYYYFRRTITFHKKILPY